LTDEPMLDAVSPRALEMARQPDGRIYALPINYNCIEVYYNQNLFERCGVAVPTTVDELTRACGEFKRQGVAPFVFYLRDSGRMAHVAQLILAVLVDDYREALQQLAEGNPASEADVASALRVMYELVQHGKADSGDALTYYEACERFAAGESAMLISGSYALSMIESFEPADTLSVFPFPGYESDRRVMLTSIDTAVCVASGTEYRDEALRFVSFLAQPENAELYGSLDQAPSCFQGVRQDHPITRIMQEHVNQYESAEWLKSRYSVETVSRFSDVVNTYLLTGDEAQLLSGLRATFVSGKGGENS
ncbi:MAG: extracellular solute-binding protein, partial [Eubacteriales bacterium]|nr:extracellular solute-binding protein [Eubacteriales bacterium]